MPLGKTSKSLRPMPRRRSGVVVHSDMPSKTVKARFRRALFFNALFVFDPLWGPLFVHAGDVFLKGHGHGRVFRGRGLNVDPKARIRGRHDGTVPKNGDPGVVL